MGGASDACPICSVTLALVHRIVCSACLSGCTVVGGCMDECYKLSIVLPSLPAIRLLDNCRCAVLYSFTAWSMAAEKGVKLADSAWESCLLGPLNKRERATCLVLAARYPRIIPEYTSPIPLHPCIPHALSHVPPAYHTRIRTRLSTVNCPVSPVSLLAAVLQNGTVDTCLPTSSAILGPCTVTPPPLKFQLARLVL